MFVYVMVCSESLKLYVGQHKGPDLGKYLSKKFYVANHNTPGTRSHLYAALRKYQRATWSIWPLVSGIDTREELDALEKHFIRVLKTQHPDVGYNICDGGEGFTGPHTPETRRKMAAKQAVHWRRPEEHERIRRQMKERWNTPEFRHKVTENSKGNTYRLGSTQSEETKKKISTANKVSMLGNTNNLGRLWTDEQKQKASAVQKGKTLSKEHCAALVLAHQTCSCPHHVAARMNAKDKI